MNPERKRKTETAGFAETVERKITPVSFRQAEQEEDEIDLVELAYALLDKWHHILLCFLIGALLLNAYSYFLIAPTYESTSKIYVVSSSDDSVVDLSDLNMGTSLTKDYEELILSYPLLNQVIRKLDLNMDYEELAKMITLVNPSNTRILRITVTSTDPQLAMDIANAVAEISTKYLPNTMGTIAPNIAQTAQLAEHKAGPSYSKYTLIGAMLGALLCCAYIAFRHLMDDTIHSADDLEKYFGLVPLTSIPDNNMFDEDHMNRKKKK